MLRLIGYFAVCAAAMEMQQQLSLCNFFPSNLAERLKRECVLGLRSGERKVMQPVGQMCHNGCTPFKRDTPSQFIPQYNRLQN
jgi:hypothetical protein